MYCCCTAQKACSCALHLMNSESIRVSGNMRPSVQHVYKNMMLSEDSVLLCKCCKAVLYRVSGNMSGISGALSGALKF